MLRSRKKSLFLMGVSIGLVAMFFLIGPVGLTGRAQGAPIMILVTFTDPDPTHYTDLGGNNPGDGLHVGELRCVGEVCNQKIEFDPQPDTESPVYEYKFKSRLGFDPDAERVVVSGTGIMSSSGQKTRFSFTGTFEKNVDDTIFVRYEASTPEASFIFPAAPGTFSITSNN